MRLIAVIAFGAAVAGCSTVDPTPKLKAATSAIDAAKAAGAESIPAANDHLVTANKYLTMAQAQIKDTSRAKADDLAKQIADLRAKLGK